MSTETLLNVVIVGAAVVAALAFVLVIALRSWWLDREIDRVVAGTEDRYARLVANRAALTPPAAPDVLQATEVVADLPWDREPVDLDAIEGAA